MSQSTSEGRFDRARIVAALDRSVAFLLVSVSLVCVATCTGNGRVQPPAGSAPGAAASEEPPSSEPGAALAKSAPGAEAPAELSTASVTAPVPAGNGGSDAAGPLASFREALEGLRSHSRKDSVRVLWLGDSHTSADFMSDQVRKTLGATFGAGGPGFVRLGVSPYRHGRTRFDIGGRWHRAPEQPSRRSPVQDGVFGLCGMRSVPEGDAWTSVRLHDAGLAAGSKVRFTVLHRLPKGASFAVRLGKQAVLLDEKTKTDEVPGSPIRRLTLEGDVLDELRIEQKSGNPELFGAYVEGSDPGVVIDTCGIEGARVATALAWDSASWQAEVRARKPDLLVVAFGTNEAFDEGRVERYGAEYTELLARSRAAVPNLPCLVLGPPDASERSGGSKARVLEITAVQQRAATELGCAFVSGLSIMGGEGSFDAWMNANPPLARRDRIHLTAPGYERIGDGVTSALLPTQAAAPAAGEAR